jgi:hypothetical protein
MKQGSRAVNQWLLASNIGQPFSRTGQRAGAHCGSHAGQWSRGVAVTVISTDDQL